MSKLTFIYIELLLFIVVMMFASEVCCNTFHSEWPSCSWVFLFSFFCSVLFCYVFSSNLITGRCAGYFLFLFHPIIIEGSQLTDNLIPPPSLSVPHFILVDCNLISFHVKLVIKSESSLIDRYETSLFTFLYT